MNMKSKECYGKEDYGGINKMQVGINMHEVVL